MTTGTFVRRSGAWVPLTSTVTPLTLPTGSGIYTYPFVLTQSGVTDIQSALNWVASQSGNALTFPSGTYPIVPSFTQNLPNGCCVLVPAGVSIYGQGTTFTKFTLSGALTITGIPVGTRAVTDGATTNLSTTFTSSTANFKLNDIGVGISGTNIPANTTIASITSSTQVVMSAAASATGSSLSVTIGGTTNPNYIFRTTGGGAAITMNGFSIDGSALASGAIPTYKGAYASGTTYAVGDLVLNGSPSSVFRSLQASNTGHTPVGGASDSWWEYLTFGGLMIHQETNPTVQNLLIKGIYGYKNTPPGEIFSLNIYKTTLSSTATVTDVEVDGGGIGAALVGCNSNNVDCSYVLTRMYTHNSGHSHGVTMYQCKDATFNNCTSINNGTGTGSSAGVGFNHEETYGTIIHNSSIANQGNTLASTRFEAGDNGGVNNTNFQLNGVTFTNSLYSMKCQNLQTTIPTYDGTSSLSGSSATNSSTQTVSPVPCIYVGA